MSAAEVEARIKAVVFPRRVRIKEFFRDYDKSRCGYITVAQFHRGLDLCRLELTPADITLLAEKYKGADQWGRVNYTTFAQCIDEVFVTEGLEAMPTAVVTSGFASTANLSLGNQAVVLSAADEEQLAAVLARLKEHVATRKVLVKDFFRDAEHNVNSVMIPEHVTAHQFSQVMHRTMPVTPAETQLLCKAFDDRADGTVNHRTFCAAVDDPTTWDADPITGPPGKPVRPNRAAEGVIVPTADVQALVDKITKAARINGVRIHEFFQDFDKLRANAIPHKKFVSGLTMALEKTGLYLTEPDFVAITECFRAEKIDGVALNATVDMVAQPAYFTQYYVRWLDFCDAVDKANTVKGLERAPLAASLYRAPAHPAGRSANVSAGGAASAESALAVLQEQIRVKGVLVKHFFQDFEANQNSVMVVNHVTEAQFRQCLHRLNFALSQDEITSIAAYFDDRGDGTVNYRNFVNHVDPAPPSINPWKTNSNVMNESAAFNGAVPAPAPINAAAAAVVDRIKQCSLIHRIRIHEYFQDFDRLRNGVVTKKQFAIALAMAFDKLDLQLSVGDVDQLATAYADSKVPSVALRKSVDLQHTQDYYSANYVRWREFANDVDLVFTQKGLEMIPTQPMQTGIAIASETGVLSAEEDAMSSEIMARLKTRLDTRRIQLAHWFKDFSSNQNSPMRVNHVTPMQFRQVLAKVDLAVSAEEAKLLMKQYGVSAGAVNGGGFINYNLFCETLQPPPPHINPWKTTTL